LIINTLECYINFSPVQRVWPFLWFETFEHMIYQVYIKSERIAWLQYTVIQKQNKKIMFMSLPNIYLFWKCRYSFTHKCKFAMKRIKYQPHFKCVANYLSKYRYWYSIFHSIKQKYYNDSKLRNKQTFSLYWACTERRTCPLSPFIIFVLSYITTSHSSQVYQPHTASFNHARVMFVCPYRVGKIMILTKKIQKKIRFFRFKSDFFWI